MRDGRQLPARGDVLERGDDGGELGAPRALERAHDAAGLLVGGEAGVIGSAGRSRPPPAARSARPAPCAGLLAPGGQRPGPRGGCGRARAGSCVAGVRESRCTRTRPSLPITSTGAACALSAARLHTTPTRTQHAIRNLAMTPMLGSPSRATPPCNAPCAHPLAPGRQPKETSTMPIRPRTLLLFLAALLTLVVAGCGGGDEGGGGSGEKADDSTDVNELLEQTFSGKHKVDSGKVDLKVNIEAEGGSASQLQGPVTLTLSGPFQSRGQGQAAQVRHGRRLRRRRPELQGRAGLDRDQGASSASRARTTRSPTTSSSSSRPATSRRRRRARARATSRWPRSASTRASG